MRRCVVSAKKKIERGFIGVTTKPLKREFTGIVATHQMPLLEFANKQWLVWLSHNTDRTEGIYLRLHKDGSITREALAYDGSVSNISTIKPKT
jgi:hypothetical protein